MPDQKNEQSSSTSNQDAGMTEQEKKVTGRAIERKDQGFGRDERSHPDQPRKNVNDPEK